MRDSSPTTKLVPPCGAVPNRRTHAHQTRLTSSRRTNRLATASTTSAPSAHGQRQPATSSSHRVLRSASTRSRRSVGVNGACSSSAQRFGIVPFVSQRIARRSRAGVDQWHAEFRKQRGPTRQRRRALMALGVAVIRNMPPRLAAPGRGRRSRVLHAGSQPFGGSLFNSSISNDAFCSESSSGWQQPNRAASSVARSMSFRREIA